MSEEPRRLQRKLAAILYADVAGYSRLTGQDEEGTHRRLSAYLDAITVAVNDHGGKVLHFAGDAVLADFTTVSDALTCAAAVQCDLKVLNQDLPENRRVEFRIGVNLGEVIVDRGEIYGDGVNVAARLEALAKPGGICIAGTVYDAIGTTLPLVYEFLGEQAVKNIDKPVRAYRAAWPPDLEPPSPRVGAVVPERRRYAVAATVAAVVALFAAAGIIIWVAPGFLDTATEKAASLPLPDKPSLAVLPFTDLGNDPQQEYFSDGITNDIITDLSKFSSLFVIASNSVFAYKGTAATIQDVSRALGVRYVLEGSVQKSAGKVRVNTQLIDATNGRHMWAQRYELSMQDLFSVQDQIVQSIVGALAVKVADVERERVMRKDTDSLEAYDHVLHGRAYLARLTRSANLEARAAFQRAIDIDPRYAAAYVGLGWTYRAAMGHGWTEFPDRALQQAHDLAQQALRLESSAGAHGLLGAIYLARGQYELANDELQRAIALNPNDSESLSGLGSVMLYLGRTDEAVDAFHMALRFDPGMPADTLFELGLGYFLQTRYEHAIRTLEQGKARNPDNPFVHAALAAAYVRAGRSEEAAQEVVMVRRLHPFFEVAAFGTRFRNVQDRERVAQGLRDAGLQ